MDRFTQVAAAVLASVGMLFVAVSVVLAPQLSALAGGPPRCPFSCRTSNPSCTTVGTFPICDANCTVAGCTNCFCVPGTAFCECQ